MGILRSDIVMKNIVPIIMAGILGIYGLIVGAILVGKVSPPTLDAGKIIPAYSSYSGYAHLASGLSCGLSSLAAGLAIGVVGDAGVRAIGQNERLYVVNILVLIFAEALGLYGLIVSLILSQKEAAC
ncbi:VAP [Symbiodinium sp. KB8]|nr:VAP [Symbiodinium sp. KB8]